MNRAEFQQLAEVRVKEAEALLAAGLWDGAYYLAGYAVECGLKACIAKLTRAEDFPPKPETVKGFYSHNLAALLTAAQLADTFRVAAATDPDLADNWNAVKDWSEQSRYERPTEIKARQLLEAITATPGGVLPWIKTCW